VGDGGLELRRVWGSGVVCSGNKTKKHRVGLVGGVKGGWGVWGFVLLG